MGLPVGLEARKISDLTAIVSPADPQFTDDCCRHSEDSTSNIKFSGQLYKGLLLAPFWHMKYERQSEEAAQPVEGGQSSAFVEISTIDCCAVHTYVTLPMHWSYLLASTFFLQHSFFIPNKSSCCSHSG